MGGGFIWENKWDGSNLGKFSKEIIVSRNECGAVSVKYCILNIQGVKIACSIRKYKGGDHGTKALAIIDELKPLFGVKKIGSHIITIGESLYIIYKASFDDQEKIKVDKMLTAKQAVKIYNPLEEIQNNLNQEENREAVLLEIRRIFLFKDILGMKTSLTNILMRDSYPIDQKSDPVLRDNCGGDCLSTLSDSLRKDWFHKVDITDLFLEMIAGRSLTDLIKDVNAVINRVDVREDNLIGRRENRKKDFLFLPEMIQRRVREMILFSN